jgi:GWxTD domain-containing protein
VAGRVFTSSGGRRGIRTPGPVTVNGFQDRRDRPLCHSSAAKVRNFALMRRMLLLGILVYCQILSGQGLRMATDVHPYWAAKPGHYLELTYSIEPSSLYASWVDSTAPVMTVVAILRGDSAIISVDKIAIECPAQDVHAEILYPIVQNAFIGADTGNLHLTIYYGLGEEISDTLHGQFYIPAQKGSALAPLAWKELQGKKLAPRAQFGQAVYANDSDRVHFYTQAYQLPKNKKSFFTYEIYSLDSDRPMADYGGVLRLQASNDPVVPIQGGLWVTDLPTGQYELRCTLNIQDMDPRYYPKEKLRFYRVNPSEMARWNEESPIDPRWMGQLGSGDSLKHWINGFYPIASVAERQQIERMSPNVSDTLLWRFAQRFWESRHPGDALDQFMLYKNLLRKIDSEFSSRAVPGYATDRGRIFLQYGPPTLTEKRPFETDGYPYEIWQYNTLDVPNAPYQINKLFIFVNYAVAGRNYELLHSDAIGEIYNSRWRIAIQKRSYNTEDIDDQGQTGFDKFGSRIYNNIIPGGG